MFKKLLLTVSMLLLLSGVSFGFTWSNVNQATLGWEKVTSSESGVDLPADAIVKYEVFKATASDKSDMVSEGVTNLLAKVITFTEEGSYYVGVKAIRYDTSGEVVSESSISWSDNPAVCANNQDFGLRYFLVPDMPEGLYLGGSGE